MYLIKICAKCGREIHIHDHHITGYPTPCEHIEYYDIRRKHRIEVYDYVRNSLGERKFYTVKLKEIDEFA